MIYVIFQQQYNSIYDLDKRFRDDCREMAHATTPPNKIHQRRLITKLILPKFPMVIKVHQGSLMKLIRSSLVKLNVFIYLLVPPCSTFDFDKVLWYTICNRVNGIFENGKSRMKSKYVLFLSLSLFFSRWSAMILLITCHWKTRDTLEDHVAFLDNKQAAYVTTKRRVYRSICRLTE